jgi:riboflavin kinase/FMN adenylyltransferase
MNIVRDWRIARLQKTAVAIGVFDGVHRGHRAILNAAVSAARRNGLTPVALTMDPHPSSVLRPDHPTRLLYSLNHRLQLIEESGIKTVVVLKFTPAFARITAADFMCRILIERMGAKAILVGGNFRFGRGAEGDVNFLKKEAIPLGCAVRAIAPVRLDGTAVSSSRVREAVAGGDLDTATRLLGRPYGLLGEVVRGDGRGRSLGFPTLNLCLDHELLPPPGVYAVWARTGDRCYPGVFHLGPRPTFDSAVLRAECHLLADPGRSLYGKRFELIPVKYLRGVRKFKGPEALAAQIRRDINFALPALQRPPKRVYYFLHKGR